MTHVFYHNFVRLKLYLYTKVYSFFVIIMISIVSNKRLLLTFFLKKKTQKKNVCIKIACMELLFFVLFSRAFKCVHYNNKFIILLVLYILRIWKLNFMQSTLKQYIIVIKNKYVAVFAIMRIFVTRRLSCSRNC